MWVLGYQVMCIVIRRESPVKTFAILYVMILNSGTWLQGLSLLKKIKNVSLGCGSRPLSAVHIGAQGHWS